MIAALLSLSMLARAADAPIPAPPDRWVTDAAGFLSPSVRDRLDAELEAYERQTGHQIVVWIGDTLGGAPLDAWAVDTFAAWGLGREGEDDGLAVFVLAGDREIDIEVGYGLEALVPDAIASRIIREEMAPRLRAGDRDGAVRAGVDAILAAIGAPEGTPPAGPKPLQLSPIEWVLVGIGFVLFVVLLIRYPRLALWLLWGLAHRGGGGGDGGGGLRGGGGRSGGGGARGGW